MFAPLWRTTNKAEILAGRDLKFGNISGQERLQGRVSC